MLTMVRKWEKKYIYNVFTCLAYSKWRISGPSVTKESKSAGACFWGQRSENTDLD